ncbi:MAG: hypothetical protein L3K00_01010 [Thermoplasmata archaeon]|nr:hypothetical protein [Thermoplasmata archaeon]MCI4361938.1 hypothetical protein [Thermoplasmata archaeon]
MNTNILVAIAVVALLAGPVEYYSVAEASAPAAHTLSFNQLGFLDHIDHIVYVVMENHAYDNYFGTYCQTKSVDCPNTSPGIPAGTCVPYNVSLPNGPCIKPWNYTAQNWSLKTLLPHSYKSSEASWNYGAMDGFYQAEGSGLDPFGHYNGTTAPIYWDLAQEYALSDNFFSSVLSYSLPNHWHIVAGQAPQVIIVNGTLGSPAVPANLTIANDKTYLGQANNTRSIEDLLLRSKVSWTYYDYTLGTYASAINIKLNAAKNLITSTGVAYNPWNPQAAKAESYNASFVQHFAVNTQFYSDARNGTLPNLSWVIPAAQDSDHAPQNSTLAQTWLASIVNAVETSPDWNTTALYITWDDFGGFYDNVAPPSFYGQQLAFRVPLIVISPYTRAGAITNTMGFFESVLRLMEWRFHLGCLTVLDCNAPLPIYGFNWNQTARAPMLFPTNFSKATYPFNPKWDQGTKIPEGTYVPPANYTYFPDGELPDID